MRPAAALVLATASVALAVVVARTFHDGATLVSPPEAVAEGFVRQILAGRSELALTYVVVPRRESLSPDALDAWARRVQGEIGGIANVNSRSEGGSRDRTTAVTVLDGSRGAKSLDFDLVRENGEWKIEKFAMSS